MIATEMKMERQTDLTETVLLNPEQKGLRAKEFEQKLAHRIVCSTASWFQPTRNLFFSVLVRLKK